VAPLDANGTKRSQCRQIRREANASRNLRQFRGALHSEQFECHPCSGVNPNRTANGAKGEWHFQMALQTLVPQGPLCNWRVAARARSKRVCARFNGTIVIAGCDHHRVNTVHYPFIVGGGAVGVALGEFTRGNDRLSHYTTRGALRRGVSPGLCRSQVKELDCATGLHAAPVAKVREYP
jgi:hypothetical protein